MSSDAISTDQSLLLFDVPWTTYEGVLEALPEKRLKHTYGDGVLELFSPLVHDVSWPAYERILSAFGDRRFRHTYSEGELEMMSPSEEHEWLKEFVGRLIELAAFQLKTPIKCLGSTTQRHEKLAKGLEPDLSYYVQHEKSERGRQQSGSPNKPPPDLVVEIEITHRVIDRMDVYAALGVPEVWRYSDGSIAFFVLEKGGYQPIVKSKALPALESIAIDALLQRLDNDDEQSILESFVEELNRREPS
jgi:Uma2 family endonuclease